jgi:hypothetical protein
MELMAQRESKDLSACRVSPDPRARLARMELMVRWDRRVRLASPVLLVPRVRTALTEHWDRKVRWDQQVRRARMERTARRARKDLSARRV